MQLIGEHTMVRIPGMRACRLALAALALGVCATVQAQVVVLVNPAAGSYVVVHDHENPKSTAAKRANEKTPGGGWEPMLVSDTPGYGSMFCLRLNGVTRFFIASGKGTGNEAITEARDQANAAARGTGQTTYWCGAWNNTNRYPLEPGEPSETPSPSQGSNTVTGVRG